LNREPREIRERNQKTFSCVWRISQSKFSQPDFLGQFDSPSGNISICKPVWLRYGFGMASITLKDIPVDLHAQLKQEADANYRSLNQEAMFRIARTFEIDEAMTSKRDQRLIDEALASGPETTLTKKDMDDVFKRVLKKAAK
jgi:hypothetical protein